MTSGDVDPCQTGTTDTSRIEPHVPWIWVSLAGSPRWCFHGWCLLLALPAVWASATIGVDNVGLVLVCGWLLLLSALIWVFWLVGHWIALRRFDRWWIVAPVGGLLVFALLATDASFQVRMLLGEGRLDHVVHDVLAASDPAATAKAQGDLGRVGTFHVHKVESMRGAVVFTLTDEADAGVAWIPDGVRPYEIEIYGSVTRLHGRWYRWTNGLD